MATPYRLENFIKTLESWGLMDVMLPFLLIFTIIFAVLEKSKLFGTEKRNINLTVALVFALLVVIPHVTDSYPAGFDVVQIMNTALPGVSIVIIAILMMLILIGLFGQEEVFLGLSMPGWVAFISFMLILFIFGNAAGWWGGTWGSWMEDFFGADAVAIIIMILVFGIIIAFVTGGGAKEEAASAAKRLGFNWDKLFGGNR